MGWPGKNTGFVENVSFYNRKTVAAQAGNGSLRETLVGILHFRMAATSLWRNKSYLGAKFKRLRTQLGAPQAITAMAHHLARLVYRMLKYGKEYVDKGMAFYEQRYQQQQVKWLQKKATELGLVLTPQSATVS